MTDPLAMSIPEKLGSFYLGSVFDLETDAVTGPHLHYDARDLTTHAVCIGMTGSGKTGLCVGLLEEAAIDRIPAIIIDPKGDMGNLLLHFPELRPDDFRPWVNENDAKRKDMSIGDFAASTSLLWQKGLSDWRIGSDRIRALDKSVEFRIYTPGSESVRPVNVLGSLRAPEASDMDGLREVIAGTVAALLGLIGIDADPIKSQQAIFLSVLFEHFWAKGEDIDLGLLVRSTQDPPVRKFGVFDIDSFMPEQERFDLAMSLNNLMASPSFAAWLTGDPLAIDGLLYRSDGTPRHSIFYIAHLSDQERMFFVTLLLNALVGWMRQQPGTTSLRALLYFDEVFGFLPPVAMPPSKRPMLTLLKQGRAFGLGTVLVTQNPVDLDYKALSNAGTWFIGRLQSKQDQERLIEGLKSASTADGASARTLADSIGRLKSRVFLMNNAHDDKPVVFHTRWAMNYLRGPMTRSQLQSFAGTGKKGAAAAALEAPAITTDNGVVAPSPRPALPPGLLERFLAPAEEYRGRSDIEVIYRSTVGAVAKTYFVDRKHNITAGESTLHVFPLGNTSTEPNWSEAIIVPLSAGALTADCPNDDALFAGGLPTACNTKKEANALGQRLEDWLYYNRRLSLQHNEDLGIVQRPGESVTAFRGRVELAAREERDEAIDSVGEKFRRQIERIQSKREAVLRSIEEQEEKYSARKQEELLSLGETVLGIVLGRRRRLSTIATKRRMTSGARARLESLATEREDLHEQLLDLERAAKEEAAEITLRWDKVVNEIAHYEIAPRRTDIILEFIGVVWLPYVKDPEEDAAEPAFLFGPAK